MVIKYHSISLSFRMSGPYIGIIHLGHHWFRLLFQWQAIIWTSVQITSCNGDLMAIGSSRPSVILEWNSNVFTDKNAFKNVTYNMSHVHPKQAAPCWSTMWDIWVVSWVETLQVRALLNTNLFSVLLCVRFLRAVNVSSKWGTLAFVTLYVLKYFEITTL